MGYYLVHMACLVHLQALHLHPRHPPPHHHHHLQQRRPPRRQQEQVVQV
jgi:hypothetical protein